MHFGLRKLSFYGIIVVFLSACTNKKQSTTRFSSPYDGQNYNLGDTFFIKLEVDKAFKADVISYWVDGKLIATSRTTDSIPFQTKNLTLGYKMVRAIVVQGDKRDTILTNIVLKSKLVPKQLSYKVVNVFPHDVSAYTEGLSYVDGKLLESTGEKGASQLKWVNLQTGKTLQKTTLAPQYFGEGSVKIDDKIIMLTWQENIGFIFDAKTFKQIGTFPYQNSREGWGLTFNGSHVLRSDGSNRIWLMNAKTFAEESYLEVYDDKGQVTSLNELEYINGKIFANVYLTNKIVIINPQSGAVEAELDLSALVPKNYFKTIDEEQNNVLNGIAWDKKGKRLFVTGKKWPKLYQIAIN